MILVTGGAGYIGSHTCVELLNAGYDVLVLDNLSNSHPVSLERVKKIAHSGSLSFVEGDVRDKTLLRTIFRASEISSVIHFAGLKAVGESVSNPLKYYDNNVSGTVALCEVMNEFACKTLVFSSSATVYGDPVTVPIDESFATGATNPYGRSKLFVENILQDLVASDEGWSIGLLRYFNPVGAHSSGLIGEDPNGIPNNLMPFIAQVSVGKREILNVFGGDYNTPDGTGVRDYIHVVDLADGHLKALQALEKQKGILVVNLGTGQGYSVLDMVNAFEKASGKNIPYKIIERRPGDVAQCYANPAKAMDLLGWSAELSLHDMCLDTWNWQNKNPNGYK
jgi:UDP-glucose 4-epimerase